MSTGSRSGVGVRRGTTVVESLLASLLAVLVMSLAWKALVAHREAGASLAFRARALEAVRTVAWLLPTETSLGRPGPDWRAPTGDSLRLRAFRGLGLVAPDSTRDRTLEVCFRGLRAPVPKKDSVLVLEVHGGWQAYDLLRRVSDSSGCLGGGEGSLERWEVSAVPSEPVLARVFETGSYHLVGGALRYRRGEGGRQPLTEEVLESGAFRGPFGAGQLFGWQVLLRDRPGRRGLPGNAETRSWKGGGW